LIAFIESIRIALEALWDNKLRALLTMLGVIIGVSSVIIMIAIVQGARKAVVDQFEGNGANLIFSFYDPRPGSVPQGGFSGLEMSDIDAIVRQCTLVGGLSPTSSLSIQATYGSATRTVQLTGVLGTYTQTNSVTVDEGRFVDNGDDASYSKACVIGQKVKSRLFGSIDPIGQELLCSGNNQVVSMTVVGVLGKKDRSPGGTDFNNGVFASLNSVQKRFTGSDVINGFSAKAFDVTKTQAGADQIFAVLARRHPLNAQDFVVDTQEGLLVQIDKVLLLFQLVLGGVGGLSLLTGGIGIMNIMLVSVTERTKEIGIRKAVGAKRSAILLQFVIEAMVVSGVGGLVGIGLGWGLSTLVNHYTHKQLPLFVPTWAIVLGFSFALSVGLFFGIYPAWRASKLDPIAALRHD
jgi:putative ABC transport system permease protein